VKHGKAGESSGTLRPIVQRTTWYLEFPFEGATAGLGSAPIHQLHVKVSDALTRPVIHLMVVA